MWSSGGVGSSKDKGVDGSSSGGGGKMKLDETEASEGRSDGYPMGGGRIGGRGGGAGKEGTEGIVALGMGIAGRSMGGTCQVSVREYGLNE